MNYTIALLEEAHSGFTADYGVDGNKYYITIHDKESGIYRSRIFDIADEAVRMFTTLANIVCKSLYSFEDRLKIFMGSDAE